MIRTRVGTKVRAGLKVRIMVRVVAGTVVRF